jgi:hypothetical protein
MRVTVSEHFATPQHFLSYKQLHYYPELSQALLRCFVLCSRPEFFTCTHYIAYTTAEMSESEPVISASDTEVSLLGLLTEVSRFDIKTV